jgi:Ca-activated chloride channel family protein
VTLGAPAALWGLLAIPFLILLYLLRVRRRDHPVSSVLLWQRSAATLAAYRPSRRLERSLLLLLQIVATAALVTGLARPAVIAQYAPGDLLLVVDLSLSMRARDVAPTRFDRARAEALEAAARLRAGQRAGVVIAGARPELLVPLTADHARVAAALRGLEPWDASGDVSGAVALAAEHPLGPGGRILVWTDAARGPLPALPQAVYRILGTSDDNVGITMFRAARAPDGAEALLRVDNFSARPRRIPVEVTHDRTAVYHATLDLPGGGSRTVVFPVAGSGVFHAQLVTHDLLPDDDVASAVLDPAPLPAVLLVSQGNPSLERVLQVLPVARAVETRTADPRTWGAFGVVILDRMNPGPLPPGDYLMIDTVAPNVPAAAVGEVSGPRFATWDRTDPIFHYVDLSGVRVARALALAPQGGRVLAAGDVPLLWAYEGGGIRALVLGFALEDSDLPQRVAFPILMANSLAWLGGGALEVRAGEALQVPAGGAAAADLIDPGGRRRGVRAQDGMLLLPSLTRAGVYQLRGPGGDRAITVLSADRRAGLIRPGTGPSAARPGGRGDGGAGGRLSSQVPLWPWLLLGAVGVAMGEWVLATRRPGGEA